jgi:hypothetical protein
MQAIICDEKIIKKLSFTNVRLWLPHFSYKLKFSSISAIYFLPNLKTLNSETNSRNLNFAKKIAIINVIIVGKSIQKLPAKKKKGLFLYINNVLCKIFNHLLIVLSHKIL